MNHAGIIFWDSLAIHVRFHWSFGHSLAYRIVMILLLSLFKGPWWLSDLRGSWIGKYWYIYWKSLAFIVTVCSWVAQDICHMWKTLLVTSTSWSFSPCTLFVFRLYDWAVTYLKYSLVCLWTQTRHRNHWALFAKQLRLNLEITGLWTTLCLLTISTC